MSTDYDCSNQYCEHEKAARETDPDTGFECHQCDDKCGWSITIPYGSPLHLVSSKCPDCKDGKILVYGKPFEPEYVRRLYRGETNE